MYIVVLNLFFLFWKQTICWLYKKGHKTKHITYFQDITNGQNNTSLKTNNKTHIIIYCLKTVL